MKPNPAGNVVPHTPGGNDSAFFSESRHAADGKAIAPVHVRHREAVPRYPRQAGHVGNLLEHGIALDSRKDPPIGIKKARHPHPFHRGLRDQASDRVFPCYLKFHGAASLQVHNDPQPAWRTGVELQPAISDCLDTSAPDRRGDPLPPRDKTTAGFVDFDFRRDKNPHGRFQLKEKFVHPGHEKSGQVTIASI